MDFKKDLPEHIGDAQGLNPVGLELFASISHEIRNPLNAIIGLSHLLKKSTSEEDREKFTDSLLQTSENLLELVNNIMDFSKLETGNVNYVPKPTDLRKTLDQILVNQKIIAETKSIAFEVEVDKNIPSLVFVEPVKLNQIILNLSSNAIKFTSKGSVNIHLKVIKFTDSEAFINFTVKDTGIGIPNDKLETIFEAFQQGGDDVNVNYGGTGLGLHISKKLVEQLGGSLKVISVQGQGSEFSFQLKMKVLENSDTAPQDYIKETTFGKSVKNLKVLIVDDNNLNIMVVHKHLNLWGMRCEIAHDGLEAVEKLHQQEFDIVLMDLHMPKMDGLEATKKIRTLSGNKYRKLPIIALTASTDKFYKEKVNSAGFSDMLKKPFRPEELLDKLIPYGKICQEKESSSQKTNAEHS